MKITAIFTVSVSLTEEEAKKFNDDFKAANLANHPDIAQLIINNPGKLPIPEEWITPEIQQRLESNTMTMEHWLEADK